GSTLRPAAYNGIVGFKPGRRVISLQGVIPLAPSFDHIGILARSVADASLAFTALAGGSGPAPARSGSLRIGVLQGSFVESLDDTTRANVASVVGRLRDDGVELRDVDLSSFYAELMRAF